MKELLDGLAAALEQGRPVVLATVLERSGSAPRGAGAAMLLFEDGAQAGTVGGGAVEYAAAREARALFRTRDSRCLVYRLNANEIAEAGMICGGTVRLLLQYIAPEPENRALFSRLRALRDAGAEAALVRSLTEGRVRGMGVWNGAALEGLEADMPQGPLDRAGLSADGRLFIEPVSRGARALIYGGGHVAQKLVPLLHFVGFRCVVCEDREIFADKRLFPDAEAALLGDFSDIAAFAGVGAEDFALVMTRGHQADYEILEQLLRTPARYIGCIGSRHKRRLTMERLAEAGFTERDRARIHLPIGLSIGAETPEEIAVSIAAELIAVRAGRGESYIPCMGQSSHVQ
ncbi:MAG: XdhC family protein [Clostridia bacterium]|nr:XdhC family protein [Clostridia bacterium]